jgi:hypothetical protein
MKKTLGFSNGNDHQLFRSIIKNIKKVAKSFNNDNNYWGEGIILLGINCK